ncbi:GmrSD restriction endonuclease domain-containing protein [Chryseobacterium sp. Mn2064]|uniref:GmrSD restriction endonuclease domain-containing protein n=1 Tax=Chryseobacterium sp. Mn2064 TaxID=3395263 RepID=UPI003BC691B7
MGKIETFWAIIQHYGIEIPPIQRDYAQGRETVKASKVRTSFLDSIFNSLHTKTELSLDFVYGKIYGLRNEEEHRRNKQAIQSLISSIKDYALTIDLNIEDIKITDKSRDKSELVYLIPLDGQQRLTTLFLIHWYIAKRLDYKNEIAILRRFRYKTRKSSSACLKLLTSREISLLFENEEVQSELKKGKFYKEIIDLEFFSKSWLNDPTVQAMLNMLQAIHYKAQYLDREELINYWKILTETNLLKFDFLNLLDFNLSDDLYVKMNARGKELSLFENFKAWLFGKIEEEKWIDSKTWKTYKGKFDIEWNDLFWDKKSTNVFDIDDVYYRFFKRLLLIDITRFAEISGSSFSKDDKRITDILQSDNEEDNFDFENYYSDLTSKLLTKELTKNKINALIRNRLSTYFKILDNCNELSKEEYFFSEHSSEFYNYWFNIDSKTSWVDLVKNYIILSFVEINSDRIKKGNLFKDYLRVMFNLFNNQTFDSPILYKNAFNDINLINQFLKDNECDIYTWLEKRDNKKSIVFTDDQINEEKRKWELIKTDKTAVNNNLWIDLISKAESHSNFKGKIGFLLNLAKGDKKDFDFFHKQLATLFNLDILDHSEKLLQRALLTKGNYFDKRGDAYYILKNDTSTYRARRENWLGFLSKNNASEIIALIDKEEFDYKNVEGFLKKIISNYSDTFPLDNFITQPLEHIEFHHLYVYCEELFDYGESKIIKLADNKYAYQLNKGNTRGYFNDVLLEFIKFKYFPDSDDVKIHRTKGWDNSPSIEVKGDRIRLIPRKNKIIAERISDDEHLSDFWSILNVIKYIKIKLTHDQPYRTNYSKQNS